MAEKRGRKSKYDEYVKPYIAKIVEWTKSGATEKEICTALGISVSTFNEYKKQYSELSDALRAGRQSVVLEIKAALLKRALGFEYEEKKGMQRKGDNPIVTEVYRRYIPPDTTAAAMLLRNYDPDWRDRDSLISDIKKQEIELKKAIAEANNFDFKMSEEE